MQKIIGVIMVLAVLASCKQTKEPVEEVAKVEVIEKPASDITHIWLSPPVVNGIGRSRPVAAQNNIGRGRPAAAAQKKIHKFKKKKFQDLGK